MIVLPFSSQREAALVSGLITFLESGMGYAGPWLEKLSAKDCLVYQELMVKALIAGHGSVGGSVASLCADAQQQQQFFLEKENQETLVCLARRRPSEHEVAY